MTGLRVLAACAAALVLGGAGAFAAAAATSDRPPTQLWSEFPLFPTTTSVPPKAPLVAARPGPGVVRVVAPASEDISLFLVAGVAFGFAAAGTALAIALFTGVQALRRRHRDEPAPAFEAAPARAVAAPATPAPAPTFKAAPARAVAAPATPAPAPTFKAAPARAAAAPAAPAPAPTFKAAPARAVAAPAAPAASAPPPAAPTLVDVVPSPARPAVRPLQAPEEVVVTFWRGYVKSRYYATATASDGTETTIAASPFFRLKRKQPVEESVDARDALDTLRRELAELGWEPVKTDETFASLFRRQSSATGGGGTASPDGSGRNQNV